MKFNKYNILPCQIVVNKITVKNNNEVKKNYLILNHLEFKMFNIINTLIKYNIK